MKKLIASKSGEVCSYCNRYIVWGKTYWWVDKEVKEAFSNEMNSKNSWNVCTTCYNKLCDGVKLVLFNK